MSAGADLTDAEVDAICKGLKQNAAKVRFLERMGLKVARRYSGEPLVNRAHYDAVRGGSAPAHAADHATPNWDA